MRVIYGRYLFVLVIYFIVFESNIKLVYIYVVFDDINVVGWCIYVFFLLL